MEYPSEKYDECINYFNFKRNLERRRRHSWEEKKERHVHLITRTGTLNELKIFNVEEKVNTVKG